MACVLALPNCNPHAQTAASHSLPNAPPFYLHPPPPLRSFPHALHVDVCCQSIICSPCWHSNHSGGNRNDIGGGNKHPGSRRRIQQSSAADPAERPSEHPVFHERSVGTVFRPGSVSVDGVQRGGPFLCSDNNGDGFFVAPRLVRAQSAYTHTRTHFLCLSLSPTHTCTCMHTHVHTHKWHTHTHTDPFNHIV